ncbi:YecA family protein [Motiliproteus coralliicola]|uniref:YecA family protein n=1 Tax=Motiliproteus coralliicola TaxID=2283196 RepID=A0A369WBV9_9GAMM|nr:YecA family protein [Motiliproteus coralliicola]RDE19508.1 YecA family protein [Motiliproteus coralliicola]
MTELANASPLDEAEIDELEAFLFSDSVSEEALDYPSLHGLLSAVSICPSAIAKAEWLEAIFDGQPRYENSDQQQRIELLLQRELDGIRAELDHEEPPELPCDLELDEDSLLTPWSQGFMEGVFMREEDWFGSNEEQVAELLLPIMIASELFDDDAELQQMRANPKLIQGLCQEIPDLLTDLYLLFRVPEQGQPKGPKGKGGKAKSGRRR